jgi:hypothetical protein
MTYKASIDVLQRAAVPALAAAISTGVVFAPRTVHAEERPAELSVCLTTPAAREDDEPAGHVLASEY